MCDLTSDVVEHPWVAIAHAARQHGDREALVFPHQNARLTYAGWRDAALRMAAGLSSLGLRPGDSVALLAENRIEWPVAQLAVAALGGLLVPLNTHYRRDDLGFALAQSRVRALITSAAFRSNPYLENVLELRSELPALEHVISLDPADAQGVVKSTDLKPAANFRPEPAANVAAALLYTSGTTGTPKGALLTHRSMMMNAGGTTRRLGLGPSDRMTSMIPLFHCAGCVMTLLGAILSGAAYVGVPSFDPETMFRVIEAERCTFFSGVPTAYLVMLQSPARGKYDLSSLRVGTCGGADANPEVLETCSKQFPIPGLVQVYGQTEGATLLTCPDPDDPERLATAGLPLPSFDLRIADPHTGEILPPGAIGEVQGRGPMVMLGYYDRPAETAAVFTEDGWLRTGDLGYVTPQGKLVISGGRIKDMIIRGGENIYPVEIENLLHSHPAVAAIAVFGLPDAYYGETVAAALRLKAPATAEELRSFCAARIARYKVPAMFFCADEFPLTSSGKVRKAELRQWAKDGRLEALR